MKGVLEHLDVPYVAELDGVPYWEGVNLHNASLMLHNEYYLHKMYGSAPMVVITGKVH